MKALAVHTVPLWEEEDDGTRRLGMEGEDPHPPVVGWCNVMLIEIHSDVRPFLLYENR